MKASINTAAAASCLLLIAPLSSATTTYASSQIAQFSSDLEAYASSVSPAILSVESALQTALPSEVFTSIQPQWSAALNSLYDGLYSDASTASDQGSLVSSYVNAKFSYKPSAWETALDPSLKSAFDAQITSVNEALQSIARKDLTGAASPNVPSGLGAALMAGAAAIGAAALLL